MSIAYLHVWLPELCFRARLGRSIQGGFGWLEGGKMGWYWVGFGVGVGLVEGLLS